MKKLLSLLMIFVFLQAQVWAQSTISSGGSANSGDEVGTFSGVLTPKSAVAAALVGAANSLGVFAIGVPSTGLAVGVFAYFESGKTYGGNIVGVADPDKGTLEGLVKAQYNVSEQVATINTTTGTVATSGTVTAVTGQANGSIEAKFKTSGGAAAFLNNSTAVRLEGTAELDVQGVDPTTGAPTGAVTALELTVDGFKQESAVDTTEAASAISDLTGITVSTTTTGS